VKVRSRVAICVGVGPAEGVTADLQVATGGHQSARGDLKTGRVARRGHEGDAAAITAGRGQLAVYADDPSTVVVSVVSPIWLIVLGVTVSVKVQVPASPNPSDVVPETV